MITTDTSLRNFQKNGNYLATFTNIMQFPWQKLTGLCKPCSVCK